MRTRRNEETVPREILDGGCFFCSEENPTTVIEDCSPI
jgi:hypothetical protein